ncbi:MAG: hypothetical protein A2887_06840 [Alphaproteobacteria bacterium RIFCSPLOWO2_01_FULL_40_26]|nr:MAG: hypothetical protein A3D15_06530 [Alphaproteobacteria bacterium RIFCSPHIGHO2_02_FULL_40_34]OFW85375.1 MAG: hypothetical protein A2794_02560 [Alphaproteobacteria bacterium RIFCSPHIGHO2_01_FULL_40_8]OFW95422.1 MAG: hypothetical protein A2887_06840 [Alphaproteobacteria bacterium RIFCSPLOWO2_01_FULL_40_26]OFX10061.1 MAG: hypothetical protein A3H30_04555 [Alphaproteobacteria bacterium RIFCSPLOWO2_02_FULL_40_19]OFX11694.1 MAG: hypothetical protein A3G22_04150 [Alphaproteobacteria bacterium RI
MNYENCISNFLQKLRAEDGLSFNTIVSYGKDLELFAQFLKEKTIEFVQVKPDDIKDYLYELHKKNLKSSSVARKISALKNFYKFLLNENLVKDNPAFYLQAPKPDTKLPKFLSEEEIFKILDFVNRDKSEFGIKLSCMLEMVYSAGLRVSELVSLPVSAIQKDGETLRNYLIVKGKGNKERIAPLNKATITKLLEYLDLREKLGLENSRWLFVGVVRASKKPGEAREKKYTKRDEHITRQRFHQMLKELAIKVGIDPSRVHPHVIRHSFATHLLNSGVDLRVLQELLGHTNIATTEIYTHILDSKLRDLVFKHHPLSKIL